MLLLLLSLPDVLIFFAVFVFGGFVFVFVFELVVMEVLLLFLMERA